MVRESVVTVCPHCGAGCQVRLTVEGGRLVSVEAGPGGVSPGRLCDLGRQGWSSVHHPERLTTPLIRSGSRLVPASWTQALDLIAERLGEIIRRHGPGQVGGFASGRCTNEEHYLFQKLFRAGLGSNNIDSSARFGPAAAALGLGRSLGCGATTNPARELAEADAILVIGANLAETHPLFELLVREGVGRGSRLVVIDPRRAGLARLAHLHLQPLPGSDVALLNGMMQVMIAEGLVDHTSALQRVDGLDQLLAVVERYPPPLVEVVTGVPAERVRQAARLYATSPRAAIVFSTGLTQHSTATGNVGAVANLCLLAGHLGRPSTGIYALSGRGNAQGALDLGALPDAFPGHRAVTDVVARESFEKAWDAQLVGLPGMTLLEMLRAATIGQLRGLVVMGGDPARSAPDRTGTLAALETLDLLVVQDLFLTETARLADVVLPAAALAEKAGTFTSVERRVQRVRPAVLPPGAARPDWEVLTELAGRFGVGQLPGDPSDIMDEISALVPDYGGISYAALEAEVDGLIWPCPTAGHPGTPMLHRAGLGSGRGRFQPADYVGPAEAPDDRYPLLLTTGRAGSDTDRPAAGDGPLSAGDGPPAAGDGPLSIHPATAARYGLVDGETVRVSSRRGALVARVSLDPGLPQGVVFLPCHQTAAMVNILTSPFVDLEAKVPELKAAAVRVEPAVGRTVPAAAAVALGEQEPVGTR